MNPQTGPNPHMRSIAVRNQFRKKCLQAACSSRGLREPVRFAGSLFACDQHWYHRWRDSAGGHDGFLQLGVGRGKIRFSCSGAQAIGKQRDVVFQSRTNLLRELSQPPIDRVKKVCRGNPSLRAPSRESPCLLSISGDNDDLHSRLNRQQCVSTSNPSAIPSRMSSNATSKNSPFCSSNRFIRGASLHHAVPQRLQTQSHGAANRRFIIHDHDVQAFVFSWRRHPVSLSPLRVQRILHHRNENCF